MENKNKTILEMCLLGSLMITLGFISMWGLVKFISKDVEDIKTNTSQTQEVIFIEGRILEVHDEEGSSGDYTIVIDHKGICTKVSGIWGRRGDNVVIENGVLKK